MGMSFIHVAGKFLMVIHTKILAERRRYITDQAYSDMIGN